MFRCRSSNSVFALLQVKRSTLQNHKPGAVAVDVDFVGRGLNF